MRIAHIITRLIIGGAQENTLLSCEDLIRQYGDDVLLLTGPPLGPEGSLIERARAGGVPVEILDALRRPIHPWRDLMSYRRNQARAAAVSAGGGAYAQRQGRNAGSACGMVAGRAGCDSYGSRRALASVAGQGGATVFSGLRALGRQTLPRHGQRGRRHDRPDGFGRRGPARKVHHDLQRHGGRAVVCGRANIANACGVSWATGPNTW